MKKIVSLMLALMMVLSLAACGARDESEAESPAAEKAVEEKTELIVFAAASMTETLNKIGELYKVENPDVELIFNFDSSGTLKTQIQEGADCDLFISAGQKQMNQLDIEADPEINTDGLDFVLTDTRINLLENRVALCVSETSKANIETFDDLVKALKEGSILMAMGNSDVPVGQYTQKILKFYGLSEEELANSGVISYGSNVKEVTTQISEGSVDCGIIYCTDAFSADLAVKTYATSEMCGQVIYPAAVLNVSKNQELAKEFLAFIQTNSCIEIFEDVGFARI